jgi:hypothetical protein
MKAIFTMHKIVVVLRFDDVYRVLFFIETLRTQQENGHLLRV